VRRFDPQTDVKRRRIYAIIAVTKLDRSIEMIKEEILSCLIHITPPEIMISSLLMQPLGAP
jgi:hypothetical protein